MRTSEEMYQYCLDNKFGQGFNKKNAIKHFEIIQKNLANDEEILMVFIGLHNYQSITKHDSNFAYAITNKRILMAQKKIIGEVLQVVLLNNINDIKLETGMAFGIITIDTIKEKFNVAIDKAQAKNISNKIHEIIYEAKNSATNTHQVTSQPTRVNTNSVVEELKGLKELLDMGVLTQDEFNLQKNKILNNK